MKKELPPAVIGVAVAIVVLVALFSGYRYLNPPPQWRDAGGAIASPMSPSGGGGSGGQPGKGQLPKPMMDDMTK